MGVILGPICWKFDTFLINRQGVVNISSKLGKYFDKLVRKICTFFAENCTENVCNF